MDKRITGGLALLALAAASFGQTWALDVAEDGRTGLAGRRGEGPGTVLDGREVPLPAAPDWQADLERAVGGLAWGDADDDGDLDLAAGCYYAQAYPPIVDWKVYVYLNHDGMLETSPSWISTDERSTADVRWADINGDGRPDLIAANGYASADPSVVYFSGPGGLSASPGWTAGDQTWSLGAAATDFDHDGDLDVAFANQGLSQYDPYRPVTYFRNVGGTLETHPSWTSADAANSNYVAWGDVDGSHVIARQDTFLGDGDRRVFHACTLPMEEPVAVAIDGQMVGVFAHDRVAGWVSLAAPPPAGAEVTLTYRNSTAPDLAASRWASFASGVYLHDGAGLSGLMGWMTPNAGATEKGIAWADVERDGDLDLVVGASSDPTALYMNDGTALAPAPGWQSLETYFGCQDLAWGDVNHDGYLDLATVHFGNGHVRVYLSDQGVLPPLPSWLYDCSSSATAIAWGDLNGDGRLDLAVGTARQPAMVFLNTSAPSSVSHPPRADRLDLSVGPQPLAGAGWVAFTLTHAAPVRLSLHDLNGRLVRQLSCGDRAAGRHRISWQRATAERRLTAGAYLLRLEAGDLVRSRRVLVLN